MGDKGSKNVLEKEGAEMPINSADQTFRRLRGQVTKKEHHLNSRGG